jgi:hypothetical protein
MGITNFERFWVLIYVWILVLEIIKVNNFYDLIYSCWFTEWLVIFWIVIIGNYEGLGFWWIRFCRVIFWVSGWVCVVVVTVDVMGCFGWVLWLASCCDVVWDLVKCVCVMLGRTRVSLLAKYCLDVAGDFGNSPVVNLGKAWGCYYFWKIYCDWTEWVTLVGGLVIK